MTEIIDLHCWQQLTTTAAAAAITTATSTTLVNRNRSQQCMTDINKSKLPAAIDLYYEHDGCGVSCWV